MKGNWAILVLALILGVALRTARLDLRPMHTDEAVHALKFGALLEQGVYHYDKKEYHGPTLNYFTLPGAWLASEKTLSDVNEVTLRIVPAFFGICLFLLPLLLTGLGMRSALLAALLGACSPSLAFYSRYYIQETLLVCFSFALIVACYRHRVSGKASYALACGACAGLMFATKETWIISCAVMIVAALAVVLIGRRAGAGTISLRPFHVALALGSFCAVAIIFFSSFFSHWDGVRDSILAYGTYFTRASESSRHGHPWYYYLQMLLYSGGDKGPIWSEAGVVAFAFVSMALGMRTKDALQARGAGLRVFLSLYAMLLLIISSVLPYKTPWLVLGILQPLTVVAGSGISDFFRWCQMRHLRPLALLASGVVVSYAAFQTYEANFVYYDDTSNPYVYSHPTQDVRQVADLVLHASQGGRQPVHVICSGDDYWPLPWYLRSLKATGWWNALGSDFVPTPIILASPDIEPALLERLYETPPPGTRNLYVPLFDRPMFLRPGKEIRGYITLDLQSRLQKEKRG